MRKEKLEELHDYMELLKTIKLENLITHESKFLSIEPVISTLNNQKQIRREQLLKNKRDGSAAIILPLSKSNNTILVVQPRVFTESTVGVELPAGYIEEGEEPVLAAIRELREETGYISKKVQPLTSYYQDQGCSKAKNYSFIAFDCECRFPQNLDEDEYVKYFECTYEEALELMESGYINDANSIITLEKSKQYVRR